MIRVLLQQYYRSSLSKWHSRPSKATSSYLKNSAIIQKFNLNCNFLKAYSIVSAIPKSWENAIKDFGDRLEIVKSLKIEELLNSKQNTTKVAYNAILYSQLLLNPQKVKVD